MKLPAYAVSWLQVGPVALILLLFFGLPTLLIAVISFFDYDHGQLFPAFIFDSYRDIFTDNVTVRLYMTTIGFAAIVWAITFVVGFTVSYFLVFHVHSTVWRTVLFLLCSIPFWTSNIIRMISWIPFLGTNGLFNEMLLKLGFIHQPLQFLLFSNFAVVVAYINLFTLMMMVPITNAMGRIDPRLIEAAWDAGAPRWRIITDIVLPLSKTGIALGSIFVLTQAMGDFYVVRIMSGSQSATVVSALSTEISGLQYPPAAASSVILVLVVTVMVAGILRIVDIRKELAS
jgi:putative spermidine/putrescine transport system permease protein